MYYWNQTNFEGLRTLSAALAAREGLELLGEYCRLRDAGLRREALSVLGGFLTIADAWDPATAQQNVEFILDLHSRTRDCHQFLVQPLMTRLVLPVLHRWSEEAPEAIAPIRWLGMLERNPDRLARVLAANPDDIEVRRLLIVGHLCHVDYATHHLVDSLFIGELDQALETLEHATRLIDEAPDAQAVADLESEARCFGRMLFDWRAYKARPEGTFPAWCAARGRTYSWPMRVYYHEGAP